MAAPISQPFSQQPAAARGCAPSSQWAVIGALAMAVVALGRALEIRDGLYQPRAFAWLGIACVATLWAVFVPPVRKPIDRRRALRRVIALLGLVIVAGVIVRGGELLRRGEEVPWRVLGFWFSAAVAALVALRMWDASMLPRRACFALLLGSAIALCIWQIATWRIGSEHFENVDHERWAFWLGLMAASIAAAAVVFDFPRIGRYALPAVLAVHFLMGVWMIRQSPRPHIDVWEVQTESCRAMAAGKNPYALTFPDIYGLSHLYPPGWLENGRVKCGFPYMPVAMYLHLPGYLIGGDYRYSLLAAMTLSALFMAYARPGRLGALAAVLFLFTPRIFFVIEMGWTDPYLVLLLSATLFCACRKPALTPIALGLFLASKQYLLFAIPAAILLIPRPWQVGKIARFYLLAGVVGLAATLPLVLWDWPAFHRSAIMLAALTPFRDDALSFLALLSVKWSIQVPALVGFVAAGLLTLWSIWRLPSGAWTYALAVAAAYLAFFSLNKFAFCNYYFFIIGALCAAVATMGTDNLHSPTTPKRIN